MHHSRLMSPDELYQLASVFVDAGVRKIRLTGGEPLTRKEFPDILKLLQRLPVMLTLTTNGILLHRHMKAITDAGIRSINVSLDTLRPDRFHQITRRDQFQQVWTNLMMLVEAGIHVKVNMVTMHGTNDDEIIDFVALTKELPIHIRFIEFMPFTGNHWTSNKVLSSAQVLALIGSQYDFIPLNGSPEDTAKKFQPIGHPGTFALIGTMTEPFCSGCNRIRLTADGKIKNCLFSSDESDLLHALRNGLPVTELIRNTVLNKKAERGGQILTSPEQLHPESIINRSMIAIGG